MVVGTMPPPSAPEDKEELRVEARRQREIERYKKLGPGRLRSIGVRVQGSSCARSNTQVKFVLSRRISSV